MLLGSQWDCHNRFEDLPDNQPGITLFFHPFIHIILLLWHLWYEHKEEYVFEGEEFGLHKLTLTSYIRLVEVASFHSTNDPFPTDDFQGEHAEGASACSYNNCECLDDEVCNVAFNTARNKGL